MKKQCKILMFALVVVLMLATMVVMASAAEVTEGAENAYYSAETTTGTKYYSTLAEAIAEVKNEGTVTVLKDVSEPSAQTFKSNPAKAYTLRGATIEGRTATILLTDCNASTKHGMIFSGDNVTITNLKIDGDSRMYSYLSLVGGTLTLEAGVTLTSDNEYGIWLRDHAGTLNIREGVVITALYNAVRVQEAARHSTVNISGGTLTGTHYATYGTIESHSEFTLNITGGTIIREDSSPTSAAIYVYNRYSNKDTVAGAKINITGGKLSAPKTNAILLGNDYTLGDVTVTITAGAVIETGARWIRVGKDPTGAKFSFTNVAVTLLDGATIPSKSYLLNTDLSQVTLNLVGGVSAEETREVNLTFSSKKEVYDYVEALLNVKNSGYCAINGYSADFWQYVVLANEKAIVHLTGDALEQRKTNSPVKVKEGVLIAVCYGKADLANAPFAIEIEGATYYYTDLQQAIFDVPNGYVIKVLDAAGVESINLDYDGYKNFSIEGIGEPKCLTVNNISKTYSDKGVSAYIYIRGSRVTLRNLVIVQGTRGNDTLPDALVYLQNQAHEDSGRQGTRSERVGHLTLDGVQSAAPSEWGVWIHRLCDLTITNCNLSGGEKNIVRMNNNSIYSIVLIENSTLTGKFEINVNADDYTAASTTVTIKDVTWTALPNQCLLLTTNAVQAPTYNADGTVSRKGFVIKIEGKTSFIGSGKALFDLRDGEININVTDGSFTNAGPIAFFSNSKFAENRDQEVYTILKIEGGRFESTLTAGLGGQYMFHLAGERAKLVIAGGEIVANEFVDAVIYSGSPSGIIEITGGSITGGKRWIDTSGSYTYEEDFTPEGGNDTDEDAGNEGEGEGEVVSQTTGTTTSPSKTTITITGGTFTDNGQLIDVGILLAQAQGGNNVLNLVGGSFTLQGGKALVKSTGGTINVGDLSNATITNGSALINYDGVGTVNFTTPTSFSGTLLNVTAGTFTLANASLTSTSADQYLIVVSGGTLSITNLKKTVELGKNAIKLAGGTLTVQGNEYLTTTTSGNAYAVAIMGGTLNVSGSFGNAGNLFAIPTGGTLTLNESYSLALSGNAYLFNVTGGTLNVTGGTYTGDCLAIVHAGTLNISGGTFKSTGGENYVFQAAGGNLNITTGTYDNAEHLLIVSGGTATISGGTFTANRGGDKYLINATASDETARCELLITGGNFTADKTILYVGQCADVTIAGTAQMVGTNENWKSTISLQSKNINLTLGGNALIKQTGSVQVYTIGSSASCVGLNLVVKENVRIVNENSSNLVMAIYGSNASNAGNIRFDGGIVESLKGAHSVGLYSTNMTVTINGGTFKATNTERGVFFVSGASAVKFILNAAFTVDNGTAAGALIGTDSGTNGAVVTLETPNGPFAMGAKGLLKSRGGKITVQGGQYTTSATYFIHGFNANSSITVKDITATSSKTMFYLNSGTKGATMNVMSGNYTAPKMAYSFGQGTFNFYDGTFVSNATEANLDGDGNGVHFFHIPTSGNDDVVHTVTFNFIGGTYTANRYNESLIGLNGGVDLKASGSGTKTINITGGTFDGGEYWIFINSMAKVTISGGTFKDTNNVLGGKGAIQIRTNDDKGVDANAKNFSQSISFTVLEGSFSTHADSDAAIFWLEEETLTINGGVFAANSIVYMKDRDARPEASVLTVNGGVFTVRGDKAIDITDTNVKNTLAIGGGMFIIKGNASVVSGDVASLNDFDLTGITVCGANGAKIYTKNSVANAVPVSGRGYNFGGTLRYFYSLAPATDSEINVTNARENFAGASVYVNDNVSGLRFYTFLSSQVIEALKALQEEGATFTFGTVIAPVDHIIMAGGVFTMAALDEITVANGASKYENVVANKSIRDVDGDGIPECYSATLINIKTANYDRDFASIPYVTVTQNGVSTTYYGAFDSTINVRAIKDVATKLLTNGLYDADQKTTLEKYRDGVATAANEVAAPVAAYAGDKAFMPSRKAAA